MHKHHSGSTAPEQQSDQDGVLLVDLPRPPTHPHTGTHQQNAAVRVVQDQLVCQLLCSAAELCVCDEGVGMVEAQNLQARLFCIGIDLQASRTAHIKSKGVMMALQEHIHGGHGTGLKEHLGRPA